MGTPYDIDEDPNYRRFIERLKGMLEGSDHDVLRWELDYPRDGFRFVRVYKTRPK
jgi:hypothetical protein